VSDEGAAVRKKRGARRQSVRGGWLALAVLALGLAPRAQAAEFVLLPDESAVGAVATTTVRQGETLPDIARAHDVGYAEIVTANPGIDPWLPPPGSSVVLPLRFLLPDAPRRGIVVNLAARRLFYFPRQGGAVETYPIGVGVEGRDTPKGVSRVTGKETDPVWYPPPSIRAEQPELPPAVPAGPANPLGEYALRLGWPNYLIHGTNKPDGVGRNVSHGCLHLYPEDIARLYREVPIGTPVRVINEPVLAAWSGGALYLQAYLDKDQVDALDEGKQIPVRPPSDLVARIADAAGDAESRVDWPSVDRAGKERNGLPVVVIPPKSP
jgi:L,D-transpeptidase ErfK/SrfK